MEAGEEGAPKVPVLSRVPPLPYPLPPGAHPSDPEPKSRQCGKPQGQICLPVRISDGNAVIQPGRIVTDLAICPPRCSHLRGEKRKYRTTWARSVCLYVLHKCQCDSCVRPASPKADLASSLTGLSHECAWKSNARTVLGARIWNVWKPSSMRCQV